MPPQLALIYSDPACTLETKEDEDGNLHRMHIPWRSKEMTNFSHHLDLLTIKRLRHERGPHYVQRAKLLELRRKNAINTLVNPPLPKSLPCNCYDPLFLQSQSEVTIHVLKVKKQPIPFPQLSNSPNFSPAASIQ